MMWTNATRALHARTGLALPSDLTDAEWAVLEPFFPPPSSVGGPRKWPMQRTLEANLSLLRGGLPWRMFPPVSTAALVLSLARQWAVADDQLRAADDLAGGAWPRRFVQCRRDR
ncbi:transposase [Novosphingobium sp. M1R2S20]|uniref:Transposase n=1 Tax=Novosphingobium rhizovicinum TaxID=3228928 RepID=A0ABV3RC28_9SPHN